MNASTIQHDALSLSAAERVRLIDLLWKSLAEPAMEQREAAWASESERRIDAFNEGKLEARDAAEIIADLKKGLRK